jgi:uncharacterized protein YcbK (DUF882 family)
MDRHDPESRALVEITEADWPLGDWPYFTHGEMACRETGICRVTPALMHRLTLLRKRLNRPMPITSGYRSPVHAVEVRKVQQGRKPGVHTLGMAVDVAADGAFATELVYHGRNLGFRRFGICQRKGLPRYVHMDIANAADGFPQPRIWSY